jgi:glycosyltransferase involved in cell wall biosynthesis
VSPPAVRLAVFAYYFPPLGGAGSLRALSLARHLPAHGFEVTVFTPRDGVYGRDPALAGTVGGARVVATDSFDPARLVRRLARGVRAAPSAGEPAGGGEFVDEARLGPLASAVRSAARRWLYFPDACRGWIRPASKAAARAHAERPFDLALSTSPPLSAHLAAVEFGRRSRVPVVLDWRDLWVPALADPRGRAGRLQEALLREAAGVVTVGERYARHLGARPGAVAPEVVFNGWEPAPEKAAAGTAAAVAAPPRGLELLHAGTAYAGRQDFAAVADAVRRARAAGAPWTLVLAGRVEPGVRSELAAAEAEGIVRIEGFLPHAEVLRRERDASALLVAAWSACGDAPGPVADGHVPAKLFEAAASGRPVLLAAAAGGDAAAIGARLGLRSFAPGDAAGMAGALVALARDGAADGTAAAPGAALAFTRAAQAAAMAGALRAALGRGVPAGGRR